MHPGPAIKKIRQAKGWKLEDLAGRVEHHLGKPVNTGNLSRLERKLQGFSQEFISAIAEALGVGVSTLFEESDRIEIESTAMQLKAAYDARQVMEVPQFENPGGMGTGIERHEADLIVGNMQVNREWVQQNLPNITSPKNLAIMVGFGDSMKPTINDGDLILVDRGVREVRIDAIYVFTIANELYIKTLQRVPGDGVRVISDNRKYDPYDIDASSRKEMEILARVVWAWNGRKL